MNQGWSKILQSSTGIFLSFSALLAFGLSACSGAGFDLFGKPNDLQISSSIDQVNQFLTKGQCQSAYTIIYPLFDSAYTNNNIRSAMAATYGCYVGINIFQILSDTINFSGNLGGSGLWEFMVKEFPSVSDPDDKKPQAAMNGMDATFSIIDPSTITIPADMINTSTHNPGSLLFTDRTQDANALLVFLSMAYIGAMENRYGVPSANYHKSVALPWSDATTTQGNGCAFAAAILNLADSIHYVVQNASSSVANSYSTIENFLGPSVNSACSVGCLLCGGSVSCSTCPLSLRNRDSCKGLTTDENSCAAAGIVTFVNSSWEGPP